MTHTAVHRIELPLVFPYGLSAGEGSQANVLPIARDGRGRPVLRGSALTGALRRAWQREPGQGLQGEDVFGAARAADEAKCSRSPLEVPDCVIACGASAPLTRAHNQLNRHTGAALDGGLFSIEAVPPGANTTAVLWLLADERLDEQGPGIAARLAGWLDDGLLLGGRSNRGIGMARLREKVRHRRYDLQQAGEHAAWLDDHHAWRRGGGMSAGEPVEPDRAGSDTLVVDFTLAVPRGQDMLVTDHEAFDSTIVPQRVTAADGEAYVRLPGSSLRGAMRAWVNRLAARAGEPVADSLDNYRGMQHEQEQFDGEALGWAFLPAKQRRPGARIDCPVYRLFGSFASAGRLHISDGLARSSEQATQKRTHVAVDRVTGGACEGLLFSNQVITAEPGSGPAFEIRMLLHHPGEREARWLADTLRAIDLGLVRIGSSKAGGRLALGGPPEARGRFAEAFTFEVQP